MKDTQLFKSDRKQARENIMVELSTENQEELKTLLADWFQQKKIISEDEVIDIVSISLHIKTTFSVSLNLETQNNILQEPVSCLDVSVRLQNVFYDKNIETIGDIIEFAGKTPSRRFMTIRNFGKKLYQELKDSLLAKGVRLNSDW